MFIVIKSELGQYSDIKTHSVSDYSGAIVRAKYSLRVSKCLFV